MKYRITKQTASYSTELPVTLCSIEQAKDALLTLMINYDIDQQEGQERAIMFEDGTLIAFQGGDQHIFRIKEVQE